MPTRKQRKRALKEKRHEYETVWVDSEGNELDEPPDDALAPTRERRSDGSKPQEKRSQQRSSGGRPARTRPAPLPPSWRRSVRRSLLLGAMVVVLTYLLNKKPTTGERVLFAAAAGVVYTLLFIPFTYYLDRFALRRWQKAQPAKKR